MECQDIYAETITHFSITPDGAHLRMSGKNSDGQAVAMTMPTTLISQLVMTLPRMAQAALEAQHNTDDLRIVFSSPGWRIEDSGPPAREFILTLRTEDGFEVSFAFTRKEFEEISRSIKKALEAELKAFTAFHSTQTPLL